MQEWLFDIAPLGDLEEANKLTTAGFVRDFNNFTSSEELKCFEFSPVEVKLQGKVYGHTCFDDGTNILTSIIMRIEKIVPTSEDPDTEAEPIYCAVTVYDSRYYFRLTEADETMAKLIEAVKQITISASTSV